MSRVIKATDGDSSLFNAIAIGLGIELLSGRLDAHKATPGYEQLLDEFAKHHPNFIPKNWENLKLWLKFYNTTRDLELVLAPVLLKLNKALSDDTNPTAFSRNLTSHDVKKMTDALFIALDVNGVSDSKGKKNKIELDHNDEHWSLKYNDFDVDSLVDEEEMYQLEMTSEEAFLGTKEVLAPSNPKKKKELSSEASKTTVKVSNSVGRTKDTSKNADSTVLQKKSAPLSTADSKKIVQDTSKNVRYITKEVDNPGQGNCAFYAFAIGLINIIQEENRAGKRAMFDRWIKHDPSIKEHFERILRFDFNRADNQLLDNLQTSLRLVTYAQKLSELKEACVQLKVDMAHKQEVDDYHASVRVGGGTIDPERYSSYLRSVERISIFNDDYSKLYYGVDIDPRFNLFAQSPEINEEIARLREAIQTAKAIAQYNGKTSFAELNMIERTMLVESFIHLIYGETPIETIDEDTNMLNNSPIIRALSRITENYLWGKHIDLDYLANANAFGVNFHTLEEGKEPPLFQDLPDRPVITIKNKGNYHWTTEVRVAEESSATKTTKEANSFWKFLFAKTIADSPVADSPVEMPMTDTKSDHKPSSTEVPKTGITNSITASKGIDLKQTEDDGERRSNLIQRVNSATIAYLQYSNSLWFSIFHRHGETGRIRAMDFRKDLAEVDSQKEVCELLIHYLSNPKNGNTHPHSYRTILLQELLSSEPNNPSLQKVSEDFDQCLDALAQKLDVNMETPGLDQRKNR